MIGPRVYAKMASDGLMLKELQLRRSIPRNAIYLQAILAIALVWASTLRELLSYLGFTLSLCLALTIFSLFVVNKGMPKYGNKTIVKKIKKST
jgi:APA family basic amino acid/polyamine antiporter